MDQTIYQIIDQANDAMKKICEKSYVLLDVLSQIDLLNYQISIYKIELKRNIDAYFESTYCNNRYINTNFKVNSHYNHKNGQCLNFQNYLRKVKVVKDILEFKRKFCEIRILSRKLNSIFDKDIINDTIGLLHLVGIYDVQERSDNIKYSNNDNVALKYHHEKMEIFHENFGNLVRQTFESIKYIPFQFNHLGLIRMIDVTHCDCYEMNWIDKFAPSFKYFRNLNTFKFGYQIKYINDEKRMYTMVDNLKYLGHIQILDLSQNILNDKIISSIKYLTYLKELIIGNSNIHFDGVSAISTLKYIVKLDMNGLQYQKDYNPTYKLQDIDIVPIKYMNNLRVLDIGYGQITNNGIHIIKYLTNLCQLNISHNYLIGDEGVKTLCDCFQCTPNLDILDISYVNMTNIGLTDIISSLRFLPEISYIIIEEYNEFNPSLLDVIELLNSKKSLSISTNTTDIYMEDFPG